MAAMSGGSGSAGPLDTVTTALERHGCRQQGRGSWTCPSHGDRSASLSVTKKDDKVVIYCHAGCAPEQIVAAVGLTMRDLFTGGGGGAGIPPNNGATVQRPAGCTLAAY